jgi:hypothetical protein
VLADGQPDARRSAGNEGCTLHRCHHPCHEISVPTGWS